MKKKAARSVEAKESRPRLIKAWLTDEEHRKLKVAAALLDMGVSEFVRTVSLEKATSMIDKEFPRA